MQLRNEIKIDPEDLVLVSPTKRTIETATIIKKWCGLHYFSICWSKEILKFLISIWIAGKKGLIG
ncbi:hypothetical protein ACFQ3J_06870 [Paenibacillus provencensis]|uniref:Uncharacterized protein n=1 Tax=Paenibacillus provencensis TaxID=441151 RepID=A0ABW3PVI1_9BACL